MDIDRLKAIEELKGYEFFVPSYQRGYRWTKREVDALLNDIYDFQEKQNKGEEFYCLQPLTVQNKVAKYTLIDGQQRLTTIFLIMKFLKNEDFFKIEYQTRENSFKFLSDIKEKSSEGQSNMDFYHFSRAYECIDEFFKTKDKEKFLDALLKKCKVLWYEINQNEKENDVFIRLNIGKIPLVEAENIKALFLSKNDVLDQDDLKERAKFWYESEKKARESEDFRYCVLSRVDEKDIMEDEQKKPVIKDDILRIESYLRAMTPEKNLFDFFYRSYKEGNLNQEWDKLKKAIKTLSGFASNQGKDKIDRAIFHYLGFLILNGDKLYDIYNKWCDTKNKEKFSEILFKKAQDKMSKPLKDIEALSYSKDKDKEVLKSLLLLFNLEYLIRQESSNDYFKFNRFVLEQWSLEHIYAQNSASISKSKDNNEKIKWLREVLEYIEEEDEKLKVEIEEAIKNIEKEAIEDSKLKELYKKIDENFETTNDLHCISNLTLLDKRSNSKIGNQIFSKKRKEIRKLKEEDKLIPIATEKVFDKVFSHEKDNPDIFTKKDQEDYLNAICEYLERYKTEGK